MEGQIPGLEPEKAREELMALCSDEASETAMEGNEKQIRTEKEGGKEKGKQKEKSKAAPGVWASYLQRSSPQFHKIRRESGVISKEILALESRLYHS